MMQTGDNGGKLDSRQCLETNQESGLGMSVIRQQGPGHWPDGESPDARGLGRSKWESPGVKGLEAEQVNKTWTWVRGAGRKTRGRMETTSRGRGCEVFPHIK